MECPNCRKAISDAAEDCASCGVIVAKFRARAGREAPAGGAVESGRPLPPPAASKRGRWFFAVYGFLFASATFREIAHAAHYGHWRAASLLLGADAAFLWQFLSPGVAPWSMIAALTGAGFLLMAWSMRTMGTDGINGVLFVGAAGMCLLFSLLLLAVWIYRPWRPSIPGDNAGRSLPT